MEKKFELKDLSSMVDKEFLLIVLGAEHETELFLKEIVDGETPRMDYLNHADGTLSEIIGRAKEFCEYRQLARIRNLTDGKGTKFSDNIKKSLEHYLFSMQSIRILTDDSAVLRGTAARYDYKNNALLDVSPVEFEAYLPFPPKDSASMMR